MKYVRLSDPDFEMLIDPQPYLAALPALQSDLPTGARAFATDPDHYNFYSDRCVKDLKLYEVDYADDGTAIKIEFRLRFNALNAVDELLITYAGLRSLTWETVDDNPIGPTRLGDLILDEILPHEQGVSHEWVFRGGSISVTAADLTARWISPPGPAVDAPTQP